MQRLWNSPASLRQPLDFDYKPTSKYFIVLVNQGEGRS